MTLQYFSNAWAVAISGKTEFHAYYKGLTSTALHCFRIMKLYRYVRSVQVSEKNSDRRKPPIKGLFGAGFHNAWERLTPGQNHEGLATLRFQFQTVGYEFTPIPCREVVPPTVR